VQLAQLVAPARENRPATQIDATGVALVDPAGHAYPALQLLHVAAPAKVKRPAGHKSAAGVPDVEPAEQA
jgi:hypothetical protein